MPNEIAEAQVNQVQRIYVKYVFLDVVRFSYQRSAEAQLEIVLNLNQFVRSALHQHNIDMGSCLLLPTGDGMCIGLLGANIVYDLHLKVALSILQELDIYNEATNDQTRRFQLRIGINQNTDITFGDVNDRQNLAGAGINLASRIMGFSDGNQIFVSEAVFDELQPSEKYLNSFRAQKKRVKHGLQIKAHQFVGSGHRGENTGVPVEFDPPLSQFVAYYFANAIVSRSRILDALKDSGSSLTENAVVVWLYFSAHDSVEKATATETQPYRRGYEKHLSFDEAIKNYCSVEIAFLSAAFAERLYYEILGEHSFNGYIDTGRSIFAPIFVTDKGKQKLKREWPKLWDEFGLG